MWYLVANFPTSWSAATLLHSGIYTAPPIQFILVALHVLILPFSLFTCAHTTQTLAVASIESGNYFIQYILRCGNNSRVAPNQQWRLIEQILYAVTCVHFHLKHTIKWLKMSCYKASAHFQSVYNSNVSWAVSWVWRRSQYILSLSSWYFYNSIFLFPCRAISQAIEWHRC